MKAAVVTSAGKTPTYADFETPLAKDGQQLITVSAAALSNLTKARASGAHYSSTGIFPAVAGTDGVGTTPDGRRVYFAMPEAPFGSLAELCPIAPRRCVDIPDSLDDVTAAAIANPGMSAWAGLVQRAQLVAGETVLINGATGTAGQVAVQLAKYLGASKVIATGRNPRALEELKELGADAVIPLSLGADHPSGAQELEAGLKDTFTHGIDVVLDYLWGASASAVINALAATIQDHPVRFVQVGTAAGTASIDLPGAALRSAAITLMGSGIGSVGREGLAEAISRVFHAVEPASLKIATQVVPLSAVESAWESAAGSPRIVFSVP